MVNKKPTGKDGPIKLGEGGPEWERFKLPETKAEIEQHFASRFTEGFERFVLMQSEPSLAPFKDLQQNDEDDLDFSVDSALGPKLLELAEFAPLDQHGGKFENAPLALHPAEKVDLLEALIRKKSDRQGGADRLLLIYNTEKGFWPDPITLELVRRRFTDDEPNFERVYHASLLDMQSAAVSEIYPAIPHFIHGERSDTDLLRSLVDIPHPIESKQSIEKTESIFDAGGSFHITGQISASFGDRYPKV